MSFAKSQNIMQPYTQIFKFLPLGNSVGFRSDNIQKLERRDAFLSFFIFQSTVISEIETWAHIFFLDWTFLSLIFGQEDCLASLRSADNCPPSLRSRKEKSNLGKKCSSLFVFLYRPYYVTRKEYIFPRKLMKILKTW